MNHVYMSHVSIYVCMCVCLPVLVALLQLPTYESCIYESCICMRVCVYVSECVCVCVCTKGDTDATLDIR
jgi:hypothetical protein